MFKEKTKSILLTTTKIVLAIIILFFLFHTAQIQPTLIMTLIQHPLPLAGVICLFLLMLCTGAWRWHKLNVAQNIHPGAMNTLIATYIGNAFNNILPGLI